MEIEEQIANIQRRNPKLAVTLDLVQLVCDHEKKLRYSIPYLSNTASIQSEPPLSTELPYRVQCAACGKWLPDSR